MTILKRILAIAALTFVAAGAYLAGSLSPPRVRPLAMTDDTTARPESGLIVPTVVPKDSYPDITVVNPTKVLLGEEKVPDYLLVGPAEPAEGLVIPTLPGK